MVPNVGTKGYHRKELPVPTGWNSRLPTCKPQVTIARNCRFPEVGTHGSQPGNQRLPLQATAGSQRLELMLPNLGTIGYHCKELPIPKGWNWWFPTWEPKVTMARNCRFPDLKTYGSQPGNQRLLLQGIAGSQKLEFMFSKLSNYHCKELPVAKAWNSWFQAWKSNVTSGRICWFQKDKNHCSWCCFVLFTEPVTEPFVLLNGPVANVCVRLLGRHKNVFARKTCMSKWYENIFFTTLWFCLMDR